MGKIASSIAARVEKLAAAEGDAPAEATADSASGAAAGAPPTGGSSGAESAAVAPSVALGNGEPAPATDAVQKTQHELLDEKLRETRERRAAQRDGQAARRAREEAEAEKKAAAEERKAFEEKKAAFRKGNIRQALVDSGEDPREFFEKMAEEARDAGKPEAVIARMREDFDRQIEELVGPLKKSVEELKKELGDRDQQLADQHFAGDFNREIQNPDYVPLLIEYEPEDLYAIVRTLRDDPPRLFAMAKHLGVRLTAPAGRFNMHDICSVLSAKHADHERGKEQRRARYKPSTQTPAAPASAASQASTVNGTAEKRNAGNPLGNDAASSRATQVQPPRLTRKQRIEREIGKHG